MEAATGQSNSGGQEMLRQARVAARVLESAANYARASVHYAPEIAESGSHDRLLYREDVDFWGQVLAAPGNCWRKRVDAFDPVIFSEWVARVPGLFWKPGMASMRTYSAADVERYDLDGITLKPYGKSEIVMGGVGTLKLPPNAEGYLLGTVTTSTNVSAGVPVLVHPDVLECHDLREGSVIVLRSPLWAPMPFEWSARFPSTRGHPLGCLLLTKPETLGVVGGIGATQIHPFTIMSYPSGTAELFDFVYATGVTTDPQYRQKLERFFNDYKDRNGRKGTYLIRADVAESLWDAEVASPQELAPHLELLERRVNDRQLGKDVTERLLQALASLPDVNYLRKISTMVDIEPSTWDAGGSLSDAAARFLARAPDIAALIDALAMERPLAFGAA
jgi:hypothetical protein